MDERTLTLVLRLVHFLAGVFWVGAIFILTGFLMPRPARSARKVGSLCTTSWVGNGSRFLGIAMLLTVISGFTMYIRMTAATKGAWAGTRPGIAYGVGGLAAVLGAILGAAMGGRSARRRTSISQQAARSGAMAVARYL